MLHEDAIAASADTLSVAETTTNSPPASTAFSAQPRKRRREDGRPRKDKPRPHIALPGGEIGVPRKEEAEALGVCEATLRRLKVPTLIFGGVAYVLHYATRKMLLDHATAPKRRRR